MLQERANAISQLLVTQKTKIFTSSAILLLYYWEHQLNVVTFY